jgi:hypothetical protein
MPTRTQSWLSILVTSTVNSDSNTADVFAASRKSKHADLPANTQMEPTLPTVCAIMAPRRAAHLPR